MKYSEYLKSDSWKHKKQELRSRSSKNRICYVCSTKENLQVHHNSYSEVGEEDLIDLVSLCSTHHNLLHQVSKDLNVSYRKALKIIKVAFKYNRSDYSKVNKELDSGRFNRQIYIKYEQPAYVKAYLKERASYYPAHPAICNCDECKTP